MTSEERQAAWKDFIEQRGVQDPCEKCDGLGTIVYGSTSTWMGGIGGAAMTNGVCNKCWGSGDKHRKWTDLRAVMATAAVEKRLRKALEGVIRACDSHSGAQKFHIKEMAEKAL